MKDTGKGALPPIAIQPLRDGDPKQFGDFRVIGRLGAGGMGEAFLAEAPDTWLVVKTVKKGGADSRELAARMGHEVEAMRRVNSPLVARVIAAELDAERPWFALEFVPGLTLAQRVSQFGPIPPKDLGTLGLSLARCIEVVHDAGVIHRDLKPDNVVLDSTGPRLIDFGTAEVDGATHLTAVGNVVGTMLWMAPEQVSGGEVTPAVDVHAWGLLMVYAAGGEVPFAADSSVATMYRALNFIPAVPPVLGEPLSTLVNRALSKEPSQRPHAAEIVRDLTEAAAYGMPPGPQVFGPGPTQPAWPGSTDPNQPPPAPGYGQPGGYAAPGYGQTPPGGQPVYGGAPGYASSPGYGAGPGYGPTPPGGTPAYGGTPGYGQTPPGGTPVYGGTPPGGTPVYGSTPPGGTPVYGGSAGYGTSAPTQGYSGPGGPGYGQQFPAEAPPPKRKKKRGKLLALLLLVPLAAALGVGVWWFAIRDSGSTEVKDAVASVANPVKVKMTDGLKGDNVIRISAGDSGACVIADNGQAYCWGSNSDGQLGSAGEDSGTPRAVDRTGALQGKFLERISSGGKHVCSLDDQGAAYCWGDNSAGQLGTSQSMSSSNVPVAVAADGVLSGKRLVLIGATGNTTCALDDAGRLYCWGANDLGQFGNGTTTGSPLPVAVDTSGALANRPIERFSVGDTHTCAIDDQGKAYCWGANDHGQLGNGTTMPSLVPVPVKLPPDAPQYAFANTSVGGATSCGWGEDGTVVCWGQGTTGQLGTGSLLDSSSPQWVAFGEDLNATGARALNVGGDSVCMIGQDGRTFCWGANASGQLGDGSTKDSPVPVAVVPGEGKSDLPAMDRIAMGQATSCSAGEDGSAWCWGSNDEGRLGAGLAFNAD